MTKLQSEEIRNMSPNEMLDELESLRMDLIRERALASAGGAPENPGLIGELRHTIARIKTIQNERGL
ncbi:MAG: 50S ribosomal protein L29P [Candidatus Methanogaster sp.]|nr:MAG: 50S ribosomal protein L29P [ANME-2 cluster archaeon]